MHLETSRATKYWASAGNQIRPHYKSTEMHKHEIRENKLQGVGLNLSICAQKISRAPQKKKLNVSTFLENMLSTRMAQC